MEINTLPRPPAAASKLGCLGDIEDDNGRDEINGVKKKAVECNRHALEHRRAWEKFRDVGTSRLTTVSTEEVFLERPRALPGGSKAVETKVAGGAVLMVCRTCGKKGDHWTSKCTYKDLATSEAAVVASSSTKGANVHPGMRAGTKTNGQQMRRNNEESSVRVTNLSEDTRNDDLLELFCTFGSVSRVHVPIDQKTGVGRGFGFVNFVNKDDAERAINKLNGFGYDHLILRVEWATPRGVN